jgi:hypothetical protein
MKFTRILTLFLSLIVLLILSCKKDTPSGNSETPEQITIDNNLIQNDTAINSNKDLLTNNDAPLTIETTDGQVIQNQEQKIVKSSKTVNRPKASNEVIMASPEFKAFMDAVFTLSDESTTEELNYVNSFMDKNDLWKEMRKDQCNLLNNEKIKSDAKVFHFWENRCSFNKAQKKVVNKFNISYDALGKLMQQKRNTREYNPDLGVPENQ